MFALYDSVPKHLLGKYQLTATVGFAALFSLVLVLLTFPFLDNVWFKLTDSPVFLMTLGFFAVSYGVISLSKRLVYLRRSQDMTYLAYILWDLAEVVLVSLIYTLFTEAGARHGILDVHQAEFERIFPPAFLFATVSLGVPYVVCAMYFTLQEKNNTIRLMNYGDIVSDVQYPATQARRITLFDNSGVLKFSINSENLYFIESDDNYIQVWYMDSSGAMKQYMLRCKLKTVEESFADSSLLRCHRKYVVNMDKIRMLTSEKDSYFIDLGLEGVAPIPVTKTYEQAVLARFNSR